MLQNPDHSPVLYSLTLAQDSGATRGVLGADGGAATESQPAGPDGAGGAPAGPGSMFGGLMLPIMLGVLLLMIFTTMTSGRRQKKEREQLMNSLGRHDKVQTSAGIIGSIIELKDDSVLLSVDKASNTRIRFARTAIVQVLHSAGKGDGSVEPVVDAELPEDTHAA